MPSMPGTPNTPKWEGPGAPDVPQVRSDGGKRADRARQFMPFASLRGYYDLVRERERVPEERHELDEEEARELSAVMGVVRKGDMVRVTYYDRDAYVTRQGVLTDMSVELRFVQIVRQRIAFDDIRALEIVE